MTIKQWFMRIVCAGQMVAVIWFLCFGSQGITALMQLKKKERDVAVSSEQKKEELCVLKYEYEQWINNPFFAEKQAREKLAMSRPNELIGVVKMDTCKA